MSKEFRDVAKFNKEIIGLKTSRYLNKERMNWFAVAINEELGEFREANKRYEEAYAHDMTPTEDDLLDIKVDMTDALIDLIYFAYGRLYEIGTTEEEFEFMWNEVQAANMNKQKGNKGRGSDDDAIKPGNWVGPEANFKKFLKIKQDIDEKYPLPKNDTYFTLGDVPKLDTDIYVEPSKMPHAPIGGLRIKKPTVGTTHAPGQKFDGGKNDLGLVLGGFAHALEDMGAIGTFGARKYTPNGWKTVKDAKERYTSALLRHLFATFRGEMFDPETGRIHYAHVAWNALAVCELYLNEWTKDTHDKYIANCVQHEMDYFSRGL